MPELDGIRIAVTRAAAQAAELAGLLRSAGADAVITPLIRIVPTADTTGIREALERRAQLIAAGFEHAAPFTWRRCGEIHLRAFEEARG